MTTYLLAIGLTPTTIGCAQYQLRSSSWPPSSAPTSCPASAPSGREYGHRAGSSPACRLLSEFCGARHRQHRRSWQPVSLSPVSSFRASASGPSTCARRSSFRTRYPPSRVAPFPAWRHRCATSLNWASSPRQLPFLALTNFGIPHS